MTDTDVNADQREFWNGGPVKGWVAQDAELESVHGALTPRLLAHADPKPDADVIDVGCGSGAVSQAFAEAAPSGSVTGIDISVPMLNLARVNHGDSVTFIEADAQTYDFAAESADLIVSRFGVMFFSDPVAAFSNLLGALRPGGRLVMGCWAPMPKNPWFDGPRRVVEAHHGPQPRPEPGAPGPMGFSNPDYVLSILNDAGFVNARVETEDLTLTHPQGASGAAQLMSAVGPISKIVRETGGGSTELLHLTDSLTEIFKAFEDEDGFALPAQIHFYLAEKAA
ncbi:class I SAM-dependent methyltransferase [Flavimaricola marinus]|uniref:Demethylmenaquinone methyltransferase n=1 Tax=Flavimaricola marinus TaxID=1819565 RepID=A0A238LCW0_9RHOB|nr:class I SAM-dependent methyltransferase [Flavimaricola marinus]SMY06776.1 Demethylmenaquinone methyltransferase [Flavimaricola marinus]